MASRNERRGIGKGKGVKGEWEVGEIAFPPSHSLLNSSLVYACSRKTCLPASGLEHSFIAVNRFRIKFATLHRKAFRGQHAAKEQEIVDGGITPGEPGRVGWK